MTRNDWSAIIWAVGPREVAVCGIHTGLATAALHYGKDKNYSPILKSMNPGVHPNFQQMRLMRNAALCRTLGWHLACGAALHWGWYVGKRSLLGTLGVALGGAGAGEKDQKFASTLITVITGIGICTACACTVFMCRCVFKGCQSLYGAWRHHARLTEFVDKSMKK